MSRFKIVVGIDPSGNFYEGKGTTGTCVFNVSKTSVINTVSISSRNFDDQIDYWVSVLDFILQQYQKYKKTMILVVEDYLLYGDKAQSQTNSKMETPKLIGVIQYFCRLHGIPMVLQPANAVKNRWNDSVLEHKGFIKAVGKGFINPTTGESINRHCKDAIRHAVHYATFYIGDVKNGK